MQSRRIESNHNTLTKLGISTKAGSQYKRCEKQILQNHCHVSKRTFSVRSDLIPPRTVQLGPAATRSQRLSWFLSAEIGEQPRAARRSSRCCVYPFFSVALAVLRRIRFAATVGFDAPARSAEARRSGLGEAYGWLIAVCELHAVRLARSEGS
jgi:hypothetical protein